MEDDYKKIIAVVFLVALGILAFLLVRPIILAVIGGVILAFIFVPFYNWLYKKIKSKNISAILVCVLLIVLISSFLSSKSRRRITYTGIPKPSNKGFFGELVR